MRGDRGNDFAGPVISPALHSTTIPGVIAVGSTTSSDTVSNFSNVGPEVTVVAPGSAILSTMPTYAVTLNVGLNFGFLDGTSMATPLVTVRVALMWSRDTGASNATVKQRLIDSAVNLGPGQFDNAWDTAGSMPTPRCAACGRSCCPSAGSRCSANPRAASPSACRRACR